MSNCVVLVNLGRDGIAMRRLSHAQLDIYMFEWYMARFVVKIGHHHVL